MESCTQFFQHVISRQPACATSRITNISNFFQPRMAAERRENGRWRRALTEKGARISSVPRRRRWRDDGCIRDGKDADRRRQTRRWGSGCETTCAKWRREVYDNGESDSVTGSGSNHHQIPLRRYGGGYTATGHSLLFLLFTLYFTLRSYRLQPTDHGPISLPISRLCNGRALKRRGRYPPRSPRPPRACAR